ncbi:hypothetical protein PBY51_006568 [Eleginops maclovinus]|uniref:FH2 domain-containing protein n=1 Tax=Eleginops maclovinus TaxID=56733 RepID=A0AAN7X062_ELEMC|nr:hypothetical protein PBY51_006568 [Eleginops maclovinus]
MEEQTAILKCFRILSEEENEDIMHGDSELSLDMKKNGFEEAVKNNRDSLSHVKPLHDGENMTCNTVRHITKGEVGNESDMAEAERSNVNLTEQQNVVSNAGNNSEKQTFATNQEENKTPDECCVKVNGCSKEECHIIENSQDECAFKESVQPRCQQVSTDCITTGWDSLSNQDATEEANEKERKDYENVQIQDDFATNASSSDVGFDPEETATSRSKNVVITVTRTEEEQILTPTFEHTDGSFKCKNEEERTGSVDSEEEEEKQDEFPDFSAPLYHPPGPRDPLLNFSITPATNNPPPGSTFTRATFKPSSPTDKQIQLPALFSGLRVLRKGVVGPEHDTVAQIKTSSSAKRDLLPDKQSDAKFQGSFLNHISQLLNRDKSDEAEERTEMEAEEEENEIEKSQEDERKEVETEEEEEVSSESSKPPVSSAEAAFDAFKAFFTPKPLKRDPADKIDLDAVRKKIRDKDVLKALFERSSNKTLEKKDSPDGKSEASTPGDGEERTPGRLHAVWPPLKEEKVGLKYTEAEHQADLLQLKRECKEELETLQEDFGRELSRLRVENEDNVARLESTVYELQAQLSQAGTRHHGELKDVAVSTGDDFLHKSFRTVCVQTDRETFVKTLEDGEGAARAGTSPQQQRVTPKKLDLTSISLSLAGHRDDTSSFSHDPPSLPPPVQPPSEQPPAPSQTTKTHNLPPPPPPPPPCLSSPLNLMQNSHSAPPPPPPPPPPPSTPGSAPPPPPPPSTPGSAPPPPPPPAWGFIVEKPPRKPTVEPSRPMKPLYWTRIQIKDSKSTLWNILEEPNIINPGQFEELFAKTITHTKRKPLSEAYEKKAKARKIIKLLEGKRSQAVGILISSLHLEMKDIQQAVLAVDHSVVDLETIEALYENRAQPEELERIKKHYETSEEEDVKLLDKPEQFLYELSQIPDFAGRAHCIIFQAAFIDGIASIQSKLNTISSVCKALLESEGVMDVMGLVLALGNHMNGGNRTRGQADGFGLEILPKLKDVKSRDNRISLVDYVVSYYLHNVDKNAGTDKSVFPLPEPQDVFLAAQVKFDDLNRDLRQLGRDLTSCEKDVRNVCSDSPEENLQPFKDKMEAFVLRARKEHAEASYQLMTVQKSFQDLTLYFGLKPKSGEKEVTTGHLFMLWFEFCADFKARWKRENKNISNERLKEAQQSVKRITSEKKVETRKINPNSLKERLRQKESNISST